MDKSSPNSMFFPRPTHPKFNSSPVEKMVVKRLLAYDTLGMVYLPTLTLTINMNQMYIYPTLSECLGLGPSNFKGPFAVKFRGVNA